MMIKEGLRETGNGFSRMESLREMRLTEMDWKTDIIKSIPTAEKL